MNIEYCKGDLLQANGCDCIVHCISADCALGAGIAKQIRDRYPKMMLKLNRFKHVYLDKESEAVGKCVCWEGGIRIVNLVTKTRYFHKPTYEAIEQSLRNLKQVIIRNNLKIVGMPKIGCGLDGKDWNKVKEIIGEVFEDTDCMILVYEF